MTALAVGVLVLVTASAASALSWSAPSMLNAGQEQGFVDVSCPTVSQCTGIDFSGREVTYDPGSPSHWDAFTIDPAELVAVSCPSVLQCTAVDRNGREVTFNPASTATPTPITIDPGILVGVDCPSPSQCTAVDQEGREVTFDPATPGGAVIASLGVSALGAIACPTSTQCNAISVGLFGTWLVTFDPRAPGTQSSRVALGVALDAIACPSSGECAAVGYYLSCTSESICQQGAEVVFDPQAPSLAPRESGAAAYAFVSVACPSGSACTAMDRSGQEVTFDPTGAAASTQARVDPFGDFPKGSNDSEIACPAVSLCTLVGVTSLGGEVTFNPADPGTAATHEIDDGAPAVAGSCPAARTCVVLARLQQLYFPGPSGAAVVLRPLAPSKSRSFVDAGDPAGLSCPSTHQCTSITRASGSCHSCSLTAGGRVWTFDPRRRVVAGSLGTRIDTASLLGISCPTRRTCTAVDSRGRELTFSPRRLKHVTAQKIDTASLVAVVCPAAGHCTAIDARGREVSFDPTAPRPRSLHRLEAGSLAALSCPTLGQCTASGARGTEVTFRPAGFRVLRRRRIDQNRLTGLACGSSTFCVAVDSAGYAVSGNPRSGAWRHHHLAGADALTAVGCRPSRVCFAADSIGHIYWSRR